MAKKRGQNEGSIHQLPSKKWRVQITIEGNRLSAVKDTKRECLDWVVEKRKQVQEGLTFKGTKTTFEEFADNWLVSVKSNLRQSTWIHYEQLFRHYIKPALGKMKIMEIRPDHVQTFYDRMLSDKIGEYTIIKINIALHKCFNHALNLGLVTRNPATGVIVPSPPHKEMQILDENQVAQMLIAARAVSPKMEALLHLAVHTGMRQMEILGLKWDDLDWQEKLLRVNRQLVRKRTDDPWSFAAPKTKYGKRAIALGSKTVEILRGQYEYQQQERQFAQEWEEYGLIFSTRIGTPIYPRNLLDDYKQVLKAAGLPNIRFHDLRHTAASLMLNHNVPVIVVSRRLGHARPSITLDLYGHLMPSMQAEAAELMDQLISPVEISLEKISDER
jgi:integrase